MIRRLEPWYPFLFALLPILNTLTRNPGGTRLDDVGIVVMAALLGCAVVYLVVAAVLRRRASAPLIPLVVLVVVLLIYGKSALGHVSRQVSGVPPFAVLAGLLGLIVLAVWWVASRRDRLERVNTFFTLTSLLLVIWLGFRFVGDQLRSRSLVRHSVMARMLAQPIRSSPPPNGTKPDDIYLIVLDEYANAGVLKPEFQFDNRVFEDSLRQLGFTIPRLVRSNYVHTLLSLPSLLNFSHLTGVTAEVGSRSTDATLPNYLLENNRTAAFLQRQGYRFLFFPSQWWPSTSRNRHADWQFDPWSGFNPSREATRSDFRRSLLSTTALAFLKQDDGWDADYIQQTLRALEEVPRRAERTFVFAHVVSPHWPYVFTADCRVVKQEAAGRSGRERAYIDQLQCLNRMVLHTVTAILQRSSAPPLIIVQGDHGTNFLRYSAAPSASAVTPAQARERFGAFGAYYLPDGGRRWFGDTVTVVNVFQKVLSHYFGAQVPPAPDNLYVSLERTPYLFAKVDPATLGP